MDNYSKPISDSRDHAAPAFLFCGTFFFPAAYLCCVYPLVIRCIFEMKMSVIAKVSFRLTGDSLACESQTKSTPISNLVTPNRIRAFWSIFKKCHLDTKYVSNSQRKLLTHRCESQTKSALISNLITPNHIRAFCIFFQKMPSQVQICQW